jgi:hypothetical protein
MKYFSFILLGLLFALPLLLFRSERTSVYIPSDKDGESFLFNGGIVFTRSSQVTIKTSTDDCILLVTDSASKIEAQFETKNGIFELPHIGYEKVRYHCQIISPEKKTLCAFSLIPIDPYYTLKIPQEGAYIIREFMMHTDGTREIKIIPRNNPLQLFYTFATILFLFTGVFLVLKEKFIHKQILFFLLMAECCLILLFF